MKKNNEMITRRDVLDMVKTNCEQIGFATKKIDRGIVVKNDNGDEVSVYIQDRGCWKTDGDYLRGDITAKVASDSKIMSFLYDAGMEFSLHDRGTEDISKLIESICLYLSQKRGKGLSGFRKLAA